MRGIVGTYSKFVWRRLWAGAGPKGIGLILYDQLVSFEQTRLSLGDPGDEFRCSNGGFTVTGNQ
jgi:hypothetical protein